MPALYLEQIPGHRRILQASHLVDRLHDVVAGQISQRDQVVDHRAVIVTRRIDADGACLAPHERVAHALVRVGHEDRVLEALDDELRLPVELEVLAERIGADVVGVDNRVVVVPQNLGEVQVVGRAQGNRHLHRGTRRIGKMQVEAVMPFDGLFEVDVQVLDDAIDRETAHADL